MAASIIEGVILKLCGRYIKNFNKENIDVGVSGTIQLNNVHIRSDELNTFLLPFKPIHLFLGSLFADIPIVLNGNLNIRVCDVLIVFKGSYSHDSETDYILVQQALQSWIGSIYFSLAAQIESIDKKGTFAASQIESLQKSLEKLVITVENVHLRIEDEKFLSYVPSVPSNPTRYTSSEAEAQSYFDVNQVTFFSIKVGKVDIRNPNQKEVEKNEFWQSTSPNWFRKIAKVSDVFIHCGRDTTMCKIEANELTVELVRRLYYKKREFQIAGPLGMFLKATGCYQKGTQLFAPVRLHVSFHGCDYTIADEQLCFIAKVLSLASNQISSLQRRCRVLMCQSSGNLSARARLRWSVVRAKVQQEWVGWTRRLPGGRIRWRAWFEMWRLAARYVALREILLYHVGFAMHSDGSSSSEGSVHAMYESLYEDHPPPGSHVSGESAPVYAKYYSREDFSRKLVRAAETLIAQRLGSASREAEGGVDPTCLSPTAVRVLYALQLELDTALPPRVVAHCRLWAEDRYRIKCGEAVSGSSEAAVGTVGDAEVTGPSSSPNCDDKADNAGPRPSTLLLAILDVLNVRGTMGLSKVDAYCSLRVQDWEGPRQHLVTETRTTYVSADSGTASVAWGEVFELPLPPSTIQPSSGYPALKLDCKDKGLVTSFIGSALIPLATLAPTAVSPPTEQGTDAEERVRPLIIRLNRKASASIVTEGLSAMTTSGDDSEVILRIMTLLVGGREAVTPLSSETAGTPTPSPRTGRSLQQGVHLLKSAADDAIRDQRERLEQRRQRAAQEKARAGSGTGADADDQFVLDPTRLTLQDLQIKIIVPRSSLTICVSALNPTVTPPFGSSKGSREEVRRGRRAPVVGVKRAPYGQVPLVRVTGGRWKCMVTANNNPWNVEMNQSLASLELTNLRQNESPAASSLRSPQSALEEEERAPPPLLSLPRLTLQLVVSQTASIGRYLSVALDSSCFSDWSGTISMYPLRLTLRPKPAAAPPASLTLWSSMNVLDHLTFSKAVWGLSSAMQNMSETVGAQKSTTRSRVEASALMGDRYDLFPRQWNVVRDVVAGMRQTPSMAASIEDVFGGDAGSVLGSQTTWAQVGTDLRALGVDVSVDLTAGLFADADSMFGADPSNTAGDSEEDWEALLDVNSDEEGVSRVRGDRGVVLEGGRGGTESKTGGTGWLSRVFGGSSGDSGAKSSPNKLSAVPATDASREQDQRRAWRLERDRLLARINLLESQKAELEDRVVMLAREQS